MSKVLEVAGGEYAYTHDLPVEYEKPEEAKRRQKRNSQRKHLVVKDARQAGVSQYDVPRDSDGSEFDPEEPTSIMLAVAEGDYKYTHELPVEYETRENARLRRKRNSHRKYLVVKDARQAGVPQYDVPRDSDGGEFYLAEPRIKILRVANGGRVGPEPDPDSNGQEDDEVLAPPTDFWDRVADRLASRLGGMLREPPPS